jgi:flagellar basal-body rod modification protein FlgD
MSASITGTSGTSPLNTLNATPATTQVGANANNPQMNQFLTLLTAQLQNQDPTSPTDPTQFVAQLAQFSTVEQLVQGNTTLTSIQSSLSGLSLGQYAGLINHTVTAGATSVTAPASSSTPQNLTFHVATANLKNVNVQITDASGKIVRAMAVSGTDGSVTFDGLDSQGNQLPAGQYSVALMGTDTSTSASGTSVSAGTLSSTGTVSSVMQGTGGAWQLQLADGRVVSASTVTQVQ